MIHRHRGNRRKQDVRKALRKARIIHNLHDYWDYPSLHALSKSKIHCSCPLCSVKTNTKETKSKGPVDGRYRHARPACTNYRYGRKYWKLNDRRKVDSMNYQLYEYEGSD